LVVGHDCMVMVVGHDCMVLVVGLTSTVTIRAYHHLKL
jgi:hypothetical protein